MKCGWFLWPYTIKCTHTHMHWRTHMCVRMSVCMHTNAHKHTSSSSSSSIRFAASIIVVRRRVCRSFIQHTNRLCCSICERSTLISGYIRARTVFIRYISQSLSNQCMRVAIWLVQRNDACSCKCEQYNTFSHTWTDEQNRHNHTYAAVHTHTHTHCINFNH